MKKNKSILLLLLILTGLNCYSNDLGNKSRTAMKIGFSDRKYLLPDGNKIKYWEDQTTYDKTIFVAQNHPLASDDNPGTKKLPLLTISKASEIAMPGYMVLIDEGIYRETVRPSRGGSSASSMICYRGVNREKVIITGTEVYLGTYKESEGWIPYKFWSGNKRKIDAMVIFNENQVQEEIQAKEHKPTLHTDEDNVFKKVGAKVYMLKLPRDKFIGTNPFSMVNGPLVPWVGNGPSFIYMWANTNVQKNLALMKRGMIFCDDMMLKQVPQYVDMAEHPGSFLLKMMA